MIKKVSIIGLGWLGEPLAVHLTSAGYTVSGTTTSVDRIAELSKHPFHVGRLKIEADKLIGDSELFLKTTDLLVLNFPPKRIPDIGTVYPKQIQQIISRTPKTVKVIFVSSTSVYGNTNDWVNEECTAPPEKESGKAVLEAEVLLKAHFGANLTVLRLAGLIGPKRHPGRFLSDKRELKNPLVPVNLIHQTDCLGLIEAITQQNCFGEIINGCSDEHPIREDFYKKAAKKLQLNEPTFSEGEASSFKLVGNKKSKELLGYTYQFANPEKIFEKTNKGKVEIVGAGPGDIQLLTLHAFNSIKAAQVLLHDNLVTEEILNINSGGERIYVGRKYADKTDQQDRQDRINGLLEKYYNEGKHVVRLKSGDPYVYGRAAEEARFLMERNIPFEVVSGISASLAAANRCNIPITERRKSNAVLICTAHTADYSFEQLKGIAELLKAGNTLALYMGLKSLDKLIPKLMEVCQDGTIPINAISHVSRPTEKIVTSTLENIEKDLQEKPLEMPVVFLIGVNPIVQ